VQYIRASGARVLWNFVKIIRASSATCRMKWNRERTKRIKEHFKFRVESAVCDNILLSTIKDNKSYVSLHILTIQKFYLTLNFISLIQQNDNILVFYITEKAASRSLLSLSYYIIFQPVCSSRLACLRLCFALIHIQFEIYIYMFELVDPFYTKRGKKWLIFI